MCDVTRILQSIEGGDAQAAEELLPLVYDELRRLASAKMRGERNDHTLQATALVNEAYLRLVDTTSEQKWDSHGHFFAAAAEAMRRILVEHARRKQSQKRGGQLQRIDIDAVDLADQVTPEQLVALDEAIARLSQEAPSAAEIVKLRYLTGFSVEQAAQSLHMSTSQAYRLSTFARAWLHGELRGVEP